ncbi:unnamed protein product [Calicophoron daubneyi]|uniref:C2 domain-containing protein n=1 Tax=Calicophoron daubneyi TaxID=300641 RepID=A0AAV2SZR2_CALDB
MVALYKTPVVEYLMNAANSSSGNQLTAAFHVTNTSLAIFLLVTICVACILLTLLSVYGILSLLRRPHIGKRPRNRLESIYMEEILQIQADHGRYGTLKYTMEYDPQGCQLKIFIIQAENLRSANQMHAVDAYVTVALIRRSGVKHVKIGNVYKSQVKRKVVLARWNMECQYPVSQQELKECVLILEVLDHDSIGQDRRIGVLHVDLGNTDLAVPVECTSRLIEGPPQYTGVGELCVGLAYNRLKERINVYVYEARKLLISPFAIKGEDPLIYVSVELLVGGKCVDKANTKESTELINPYFNNRLGFLLRQKDLKRASLKFCVRCTAHGQSKHTIGHICVGSDTVLSFGREHWEEMLNCTPRVLVNLEDGPIGVGQTIRIPDPSSSVKP